MGGLNSSLELLKFSHLLALGSWFLSRLLAHPFSVSITDSII